MYFCFLVFANPRENQPEVLTIQTRLGWGGFSSTVAQESLVDNRSLTQLKIFRKMVQKQIEPKIKLNYNIYTVMSRSC